MTPRTYATVVQPSKRAISTPSASWTRMDALSIASFFAALLLRSSRIGRKRSFASVTIFSSRKIVRSKFAAQQLPASLDDRNSSTAGFEPPSAHRGSGRLALGSEPIELLVLERVVRGTGPERRHQVRPGAWPGEEESCRGSFGAGRVGPGLDPSWAVGTVGSLRSNGRAPGTFRLSSRPAVAGLLTINEAEERRSGPRPRMSSSARASPPRTHTTG